MLKYSNLEYFKTLEWYYTPLLYIATNELTDKLYLLDLYDSNENINKWMVCEINEDECLDLIKNCSKYASCFKNKSIYCFEVDMNLDIALNSYLVDLNDLDDDYGVKSVCYNDSVYD